MSERLKKLEAFLGKSDKTFGEGKISFISSAKGVSVQRFSSGIFGLDSILGGGWPWGRMVLVYGPESSGKTTLACRACASIQELSAETRLPRTKPEEERCRALYVDQESVLDRDWGTCLGMDMSHHLIARPESGEEAIDLITAAIYENIVDIIVLDSIAACTPTKEIEDGSGVNHPGLQARLMNQAFRKWQSALTKVGNNAPAFFLINQTREKIGVMYGDPTTLPGGNAQHFAATIKLRLSRIKMEDSEDKVISSATFSCVTVKNKTFTQKLEATFSVCVKDMAEGDISWKKGSFQNAPDVYKAAKKFDLCGHTWNTGRKILDDTCPKVGEVRIPREEIIKVSKDAEMVKILHDTPVLEKILWQKTLKKVVE